MAAPASSRPRRTKANVHPGQILLDQKQARRSSAEVARERAELEAQREAVLKRREEAMKALAELDAQLKAQDEQDERNATRPPRPPTAQQARTASARTSKSTPGAVANIGKKTPTAKAAGNGTATDAAGDTRGILSVENSPGPSPTPLPKKPVPRRSAKLTRAEFEAYRDSHAAVAAAAPVQGHTLSASATKENINPTNSTPQTGEKRPIEACMEEQA